MAYSPKPPAISPLFFLLVVVCVALLPIAQLTLAGRPLQAANPNENKETRGTPSKRQAEANVGKKRAAANPSGKKQPETNPDRKQTECLVGYTVGGGIPGAVVGGGSVPAAVTGDGSVPAAVTGGGSVPAAVTGGGSVPAAGIGGSVPAAGGGRYIPGYDDTFVPNPGFEVPNPAYGATP